MTKKISNMELRERLKVLSAVGAPLGNVLEAQKSKKKPPTKKSPKPRTKPSNTRVRNRVSIQDEDKEFLDSFIFIFNHRPYEATLRHNTVNLLDLTTYQSNITHTLWEDEEVQHLHDYLQRNWEHLEVHKEDDAETSTFLIDALFDIVPQSQ